MRIVCPACAAAYQVPDANLAIGRVVRCARCETDWVPLPGQEPTPPPEAAPIEPPEPLPEPEPIADIEEPPPAHSIVAEDRYTVSHEPPSPALRLAWMASLALLVAGLTAVIMARDGVMRMWAPSIRAYAMLGLTGAASSPDPAPQQKRPAK